MAKNILKIKLAFNPCLSIADPNIQQIMHE